MSQIFSAATNVTATGEFGKQCVVTSDYNIGPIPNGGYLMAIIAKAMAQDLPHNDPYSVTAYYLDRSDNATADLDVEVIREGRSVSTAMGRIVQSGTERVRAVASFSDLDRQHGETHIEQEPPQIPAPEDCSYEKKMPVALNDSVDVRFSPDSVGWLDDECGDISELTGWIRLNNGEEPDAFSLLLFADAFPPAVFNRIGRRGWVPTIELTVHVRKKPANGWCLCRFRTRYLTDGSLEADGEIWDSNGDLVALSRQLAKLRLPEKS